MTADGELILQHLKTVANERARRASTAGLSQRVEWVKAYQQARFRHSYADLLADARHRPAALFFVEELYGPADFSERDAQFARIVPALVRLFPQEIVQTVAQLASLHALSEVFDTRMAAALSAAVSAVDASAYVGAWQAVGDADGRGEQIRLVLEVGAGLDRLTRKPLLRQSLRLMRAPARAAGLSALQAFLERGFDTFAAMKGAQDFLQIVAQREEALRQQLFAADAPQRVRDGVALPGGPLSHLPPSVDARGGLSSGGTT